MTGLRKIKFIFFRWVIFFYLVPAIDSFAQVFNEFSPEVNQQARIVRVMLNENKRIGNYDTFMKVLYNKFAIKPLKDRRPYIFEFPNGNRYLIEKTLGQGTVTNVFRAINLKTRKTIALRIPLNIEKLGVFNEWANNHSGFKAANYPTPDLYANIANQFTEVELIDVKFTLEDLMEHPEKFKPEVIDDALLKYKQYIEKTSDYVFFADDKPLNIGFDGEKWVALDWSSYPITYDELLNFSPHLRAGDYFALKADHSYLRFIETSTGDALGDYVHGKMAQIHRQNEKPGFERFLKGFYQILPEKYQELDFEKQLQYAKTIDGKTQNLARLSNELLLKAESSADLLNILTSLDLKLNLSESLQFDKRWVALNYGYDPVIRTQYIAAIGKAFNSDVSNDIFIRMLRNSPAEEFVGLFKLTPLAQQSDIFKSTFPLIYAMVPHEKKQVFLHHLNIQNFSPEIVEFIKLMTPNIKMMESEVVSENQKKLNCTIKHLTQ